MKRSVILLIVLGTVAAIATTVLVNSLRIGNQQTVLPEAAVIEETTIVVAAQDLPRGTFLSRRMVETRQIQLKDMPEGSVGDPEQAVRRVLAKPIKKGDLLLTTMFAQNFGEGLPEGMVSVEVSVDGSCASLYLACKINVIWTPSARSGQDAKSTRMFTGVSVWGIGDRTIVSPDGADGQAGRSSRRDKTVMLLLDMDQAERIIAATQRGTISLVLCHPEATWTVPEPSMAPESSPTPAEEWEVWVGEKRIRYRKEGGVWRRLATS